MAVLTPTSFLQDSPDEHPQECLIDAQRASTLAQDQIRIQPLVPKCGICVEDFVPRGLQYAFQAAQQGERQDGLAEVGLLEIAPQVVGVFPYEAGERGVGRGERVDGHEVAVR